MSPSLHGCGLKLDRAKHHLDVLEAEVAPFIEDAYLRTVEVEAAGKEHSYKLYVLKQIPEQWSLIAGDCLHNLRSALDHLIFQLALIVEDPLPENVERACAFPICSTYDRFAKQKSRVAAIPPDAISIVEELQPYAADKPKEHPLRILESLNNIDKHRRLNVVASIIRSSYLIAPNPPGVVSQTGHFGGRVENGMEYARVAFDRPHMEQQFDVPAGVEITIQEALVGHQPLIDLMHRVRHHLLNVVIPPFHRFF